MARSDKNLHVSRAYPSLRRWQAAEDAHPGEEAHRTPFDRLRVLADFHPLFALRNFSATQLTREREAAFASYEGLEAAWLDELTEAEATQNFGGGREANLTLSENRPLN